MKKIHTFLFTSKNIIGTLLCFITLTVFAMPSLASETVYITPRGKAYHEKDCRSIARSKTILTVSVFEAEKRGYRACEICIISNFSSNSNSSNILSDSNFSKASKVSKVSNRQLLNVSV